MHIITSNIFGNATAEDMTETTGTTETTETGDTGTVEIGDVAPKTGKAKRNAAVKGVAKADDLGVFKAKKAEANETAAPKKKALFAAKADKPAKAKPAKAAKEPKATKPAKEPKPAATKVTPAPVEHPVETLFAEFEGGKADVRALLYAAYNAGKAAPRARTPRAGGPTKRDLAADLLQRKQGCTAKDILEATGWPAVSVPAIARASNLTLTQTKEGRTTTYFGTPA